MARTAAALVLVAVAGAACFVDAGAHAPTAAGTGSTTTTDPATTHPTSTGDPPPAPGTTTGTSTGTSTDAGDATEPDATTGATTTDATTGAPLPGCGADPALLACYRFEGDGEALVDDGPFAHPGSVAPPVYGPGVAGQALDLSPASAAQIPDAPHLTPAGPLTIALWVFPRTLPAAGERAMLFDRSTQYGAYIRDGLLHCTSTGVLPSATVSISPGRWTHVACVHAEDMTTTLVVDGDATASQQNLGIGPGDGSSMRLGNDAPTPTADQALDGMIDEFKLWSRALTPKELAAEAGCGDGVCGR